MSFSLMKTNPFLLVILAMHFFFVGGCLLYGGLLSWGFLAMFVCAGLSMRAKRDLVAAMKVWDEEVEAMSAGEMPPSFEEEVEALLQERLRNPVLGGERRPLTSEQGGVR